MTDMRADQPALYIQHSVEVDIKHSVEVDSNAIVDSLLKLCVSAFTFSFILVSEVYNVLFSNMDTIHQLCNGILQELMNLI